MKEILDQYKKSGDLHHFYLLEGDKEKIKSELNSFLEKNIGVDLSDRTLFYPYEFNDFLVDDSRDLLSRSQIKTPQNKKMVFVISINSINREAQNALLKLFEEPSERTYFFLILPMVNNLLPTFTSRAVVIRKTEHEDKKILDFVRAMSVKEKMKFVEDLVKDIKDGNKDKIEALELIRNIISNLEEEITANPDESGPKKYSIERLMEIEDYLKDSGASTKILLERAMLLL